MKQQIPLPDIKRYLDYSGNFNKDIIIFGAGVYSEPAIHSLKQFGVTPVCICDNSLMKVGTKVMGISVILPNEAFKKYPEAIIIITAAWKYFDEINSQLKRMGWNDIYDCANLLSNFEYDRDTFTNSVGALNLDLDSYFYEYFIKNYPDKLILPSVDIVITEKCSLKCKDCSNLMQYYSNPKDIDFDKLFGSLDVLMECVDYVFELRILGGETFMNKYAHKYIERLFKYKNFTRIAVYSNGTIIPKDENLKCLINEKIYLRISDYGELSRNLEKMKNLFSKSGIVYDSQQIFKWQDCAQVRLIERTLDDLKTVYSSCCAKNTFTLHKAKLYICPFAANADNLEMLPHFSDEIIKLDKDSSYQQIRNRLFDMLRNKLFYSVCNFCSGRSLEELSITAAIQTEKPLFFEKNSQRTK